MRPTRLFKYLPNFRKICHDFMIPNAASTEWMLISKRGRSSRMKFLGAYNTRRHATTHARGEPGGELPNYKSLIWINIPYDRGSRRKNDADVTGWQLEGGARRCKRSHVNKKAHVRPEIRAIFGPRAAYFCRGDNVNGRMDGFVYTQRRRFYLAVNSAGSKYPFRKFHSPISGESHQSRSNWIRIWEIFEKSEITRSRTDWGRGRR